MTVLRGRYINLENSHARKIQIEKQLTTLGQQNNYKRFEAIRGDDVEASKRNLRAGELGIWKSWIKLLSEESIDDEQYEFLHIIEDDCILTKELYKVIENSRSISPNYDLLVTDMYVNPSIYRYLAKSAAINKKNKKVEILRSIYTGCTASVIIPKDKIKKLRNLLAVEYNKTNKLVPIDNLLIRLLKEKQIKTGVTLPFITSISPDSITNSTIQPGANERDKITKTQEVCYLLRKQLSILPEETYCHDMIKAATELVNLKTNHEREENEVLTNMAIDFLEKEDFLAYRFRANLEGEPWNPQAR